VLTVNDRCVGHGLGKRDVDGRTKPQVAVKLVGDLSDRAFLHAESAAGTFLFVNKTGFFADGNLEVADIPLHMLYLSVGCMS